MIYYYIVLYLHFILTLFMLFGWMFTNNVNILQLELFLLILGIVLYIKLGGCFITKLEKKLSGGSDYTVIDPLLKLLGVEKIRNNNRSCLTFFLFIIATVCTIYKLKKLIFLNNNLNYIKE